MASGEHLVVNVSNFQLVLGLRCVFRRGLDSEKRGEGVGGNYVPRAPTLQEPGHRRQDPCGHEPTPGIVPLGIVTCVTLTVGLGHS